MRRLGKTAKKLLAGTLAVLLAVGSIPTEGLQALAAESKDCSLDNGYIKVDVSGDNGGFYISTVEGDKINKDDNNKSLLFHNGIDDTSFTSFRITRGDETNEYIFGESYKNSSIVEVTENNGEINSVWTVDDITFTQTIRLVNSGSTEHGMVYISYNAENKGKPADIKARLLLDTAMGSQDYAYYNIGNSNALVEHEITIGEDGYNKSFYGYNDPFSPTITSYVVNASVDNRECKPYQTTFAHWNNLASTVFDYNVDEGMTFTNPNNKKYLTSDSAFAMYYDFGEIQTGSTGVIATNYGVFSNEKVKSSDTATVNITAPAVLELNDDKTAYKDDGYFTIKTSIKNVGEKTYDKVRVAVYTNAGINPLDQAGNDAGATYDNPYKIDYLNFVSDQTQSTEWKFKAEPMEEGQYATVHYKVYDMSSDKTLNTDEMLAENLIGEGSTYILCPGSVNSIPQIQFTGSSPEILYNKGQRSLYITGKNFSMLQDKSAYQVLLSRVDGQKINGNKDIVIPDENFRIDSEKNTITVVMNDNSPGVIPEGQYQLTIDYTQADKEDITAPALRFMVKEDEKYRNDTYGLLVAEKSKDLSYTIHTYADENEYKKAIKNGSVDRENCLLEFRGVFTKKQEAGSGKITYTGVSLNDDDNVMTLNNCLDIKNGTTTITEENGSVKVDFDAQILTTGANTKVWKGVCALTELEKGTEYGLIPYEENGERADFDAETITLLWTSVGQAAQNMLGFLMDFKYGELGTIQHDNGEETRVVAFGAALDMNFLAKASDKGEDNKSLLGDAYNAAIHKGDVGAEDLRAINKRVRYNTDTVNTDADDDDDDDLLKFSGSIQIDDVLFGGKYLGVCFTVALGIPAFVEGMPEIEGELTVKTVGNWELGVSGQCDFDMFCLEAEVYIKSRGNAIIPDRFRIFLGNITPGLNVDGMGILWLQGAGGGIDNLYDTIFLTEAVPPLQLLIEAQFSLMQVISARASLKLSLRGIGVELSDGKVMNKIDVLESAKLELDWYPEFYFMSSVYMNVMDVIVGGGYIVAEQSGFFEFFVRAALQIPEDIPLIGGTQVASAGIGANVEKMWGQIELMSVKLGVVYYWGGSVEWGGGDAARPTYPELAGMSTASEDDAYDSGDVPVYYDQNTGKTLYMRVGTNMSNTTKTANVTKFQTGGISNTMGIVPVAYKPDNATYMDDTVTQNSLQSLVTGKEHLLTLAPKAKDEMFSIQWQAESMEEAEADAKNVKIADYDTKDSYGIKILDNSKTVEEQPDANANLTYDADSKTATLVVTFSDEKSFNRKWKITTKKVSNTMLYDLEELPEISDKTAVKSAKDGKMSLSIKGTKLNKYDDILFSAVRDGEEEGIMLYKEEIDNLGDGNITFDLPEDLQSGDYTLRITATDREGTYHSSVEKTFSYENKNQPAGLSKVSAENAGDYRTDVKIENKDTDIDGYRICVYDNNGEKVSGLSDMMYTADGKPAEYNEDGSIKKGGKSSKSINIEVGGKYEYEDPDTHEKVTVGLEAGKQYTVGVSSFKLSDNGSIIYSEEKKSSALTIEKPVNTTIKVSGDSDDVTITEEKKSTDGSSIKFETPFYKKKDLNLTVSANNSISGTWTLDGGNREQDMGEFKDKKTLTLNLENLDEGTHTLEITGKNSHGDAVREVYTFGVDTEGPRLLISSPVSGEFFDSTTGNVKITGVTDEDTELVITDKDTGAVYGNYKAVPVDASGVFEADITADKTGVSHSIVLTAKDRVGNVTEKEIQLISDAMGMVESVDIYSEDMLISDKVISAGATYPLKMAANLKDGNKIDITNSNLVEWNQSTIEGEAEITDSEGYPELKVGDDAVGILTARFRVSDAGSYSVSAAFKETGSTDIKNAVVSIPDTNYYTGKQVKVKPQVWVNGVLLTEGTDYSLSYSNNKNVTTDDKKAVVTIKGQGDYKGSINKEFDIIYLDDKDTYTVSGIDGDNGWATSAVKIKPNKGYQISDTSQTEGYSDSAIKVSEEGKNMHTFYIMRVSDGAISDKIEINTKVDSSAPTGSITLDRKSWKTFKTSNAFTPYKLADKYFGISGKDTVSGVASIEYVLVKNASYKTVKELLAANPDWVTYDANNRPSAKEGKKLNLYVRITDRAGNVTYINSDGILMDTTAPEITSVEIKDDETLLALQADIGFVADEPGTYYYAVVPAGKDVPTAEQIISGDIEGAVCGNGKISSKQAGTEIRQTVTGLHRNTEYMLYVVAKDKAVNISTGNLSPNISDVAVSEKSVTTKDVATDISDSGISCKISGDTYYTGSEVRPKVTVKHGNRVLKEGEDYTLSYSNNVDVSAGTKAVVTITGIGDYTGERTLEFTVKYLGTDGKYTVNGSQDGNGVYETADIVPAKGYQIQDVTESETVDGIKTVSFRVRRSSDGALSDTISIRVKAGETPTETTETPTETPTETQQQTPADTQPQTTAQNGATEGSTAQGNAAQGSASQQQTTSPGAKPAAGVPETTKSAADGDKEQLAEQTTTKADKEKEEELTSEEETKVSANKKLKDNKSEKKANYMPFIIGGIVIAGLAVIIIIIILKRRKENE